MTADPFQLHDRLAADTALIVTWPLCQIRLMLDQTYPWLILVPARTGLRELHELASQDRMTAMEEITRASRALEGLHRPDKINIGAIGNMVPQLHIHIVARFKTDPAWPSPPWGAVPPTPYTAAERDQAITQLKEILQ